MTEDNHSGSPEQQHFDAAYQNVGEATEENLENIDRIEQKGPPRATVAAWLARALMFLFVFQGIAFTLTYLGVAQSLEPSADLVLDRLKDGARDLLTITSPLLGVALGYYFRERL